jgi:phosphoribosylglycinamide formyltransferase-1
MNKRIAIFASGFGSNARVIMNACCQKEIQADAALLFSDNADAHVFVFAREFGVHSEHLHPKAFESKAAYENALLQILQHHKIDFIVLAGYMRLIGKTLLEAYEGNIINIHPSLLPKYRGLDAIGQAIENGDEEIGVTIHYVDAGMDTGRIIAQKKIEQNIKGREKTEIEKLVHQVEHELYVGTLKQIFDE